MKRFDELFSGGRHRGGGLKSSESQLRLSVSHETKYEHRMSLAFTIGGDLARRLRWVVGDKVTLHFDCVESQVAIVRVPESSPETKWTLGGPKYSRNRATGRRPSAVPGASSRCRFSVTATPVMLDAFGMRDSEKTVTEYIPESVSTGDGGLVFPLRKPWTVTNR